MDSPLGYDEDDLSFRLMEAERALADAEAQYQRIADALPYGIWTCGPDGELLHISQSFLNLLGMTLEECQQFGWWGKLPPDEIEGTRSHWKHCLLNGLPYNHEHYLLGRDGMRHAVLVRGVPVKDDMGRVIAWVGINLDIDDRKRAEAAIRESELRFRTMADEAPVLIWMTDSNGEGTYYNRRWVEMTGVPLDEQLCTGWLGTLHPDDQERTLAVYQNALKRRAPFENSYRIKDAKGNFRLLLDRGAPRFLDDGTFAGYVGCCTDVTDLQAAQEGAVTANERYRMVCDSLNALVYDHDLRTGKVHRSDGLYRALGRPLNESDSPFDVFNSRVHPDDLDRVIKVLYETNTPNGLSEIEYRILNGAGEYVPVYDRAIRTYDQDGNLIRVVGCVTKISESRSVIPGSKDEDLLRAIVEFCPTPALMVGRVTEKVLANRFTLELFGCDRETFDTEWLNLVHPDDRKVLTLEWELALAKVRRLNADFRVVRADGQIVDVQLALSPMRDNKGVLIGFVGLMTDVTQSKVDRRRLEQSEANYRSLAEAAPDHVISILPDYHCDFANSRWCEFTGLSFDESLGQGWLQAIQPDDLALTRVENAPNELELRIRRHDGEYRWFLLRRTEVRDASGEIIKHLVTGTDIHNLKSTTAALKESEKRLRMALNIAKVLLFGIDLDLRFTWVYVPPSTTFPVDKVLGKADEDVLSPLEAARMTELKRRVIDRGESVHQLVNFYFADKERTYEIMMEPLRDESGLIIGITGAAIDHTDKMQTGELPGQAFLSVMN